MVSRLDDFIIKAQGVPTKPGPAPGPAPRIGLEWEPNSHRWVRVKVGNNVNRPIRGNDVPTLNKLAPESTNELLAHINDLPKHGRKYDHLLGFLESYARIADEGKDCPDEIIDHAWDQIKNTFSIFQNDLPKDTPYQWAVEVKRDPSRINKIVAIDHIAHLMHDRGSILPHMLGEEDDWFASEFNELDEDVKDILEDISKSSDNAFMLDIQKAQGVPIQSGPPPGPPPRSGLEWNSNSHRWVVSGGKAENYRRIYNDLVRLRHPYSAIPEFDIYDEVAPDIPMEKRVVGQKFGMCYMNAYRYYKTTGMKVVVGYAVEKESVDKAMNLDYDKDYWLPGINTTLHAWNVDNQGRVVDTSLGSKDARNHVYFGKTVPEESLGKVTNDLEGEKEVIDYVGKVMDEESSRIRSETASEDELNRNYDEWKKRHDSRVVKARGVAIAPGPPPGAPPRPGLEWDSDSHRWIRPEDAKLHDEIASKSHESSKNFIEAIRHLSPEDQIRLGKHLCWDQTSRRGAYFSNMDRNVSIQIAKYLDERFLTDVNDPNFLALEGATEDMMRNGADPEARRISYETLKRHPIEKTVKFIRDVYGFKFMTGNVDKDIDNAVSGYEATAAGPQAKWMMVAADKIFNGEDAEYNELGIYTYRFPEPEYYEIVKKLYEQTQEYYKKKGITHIKMFRGLTKHRGEEFTLRDSEALTSWTTDKQMATFHAKRGNIKDKHYSAYIVTVDMPVENILYSHETVPQLKTQPFRRIVDDDNEFVVIKKKDQKLFKGQGAIVRIQPDDEENAELLKTKGVATNYGPPPGPSPRPGLVWKPDSHRWTKPEESSKEAIRIVEEPYNKQLRIKRGFTQIVTIDAKKFQDLYEKTHEEKLAWNQDRAKKLKDLKTYDSYPLATNSDRGVDVGDGRHRIAEAARRGALVEVATDPKFPLPDDLIEEVHEVETEEAKSDVFARDYWDDLLEHNELRMSGNKTSQGALTAYLLEAAGDVLRELGKPDAYDIDPAYINEKLRRIRMNLTDKSWDGRVEEPESTLLHQIQSDIQGIPVTSKRIGAVKQLITAIANRDKMATKEILGSIDTELDINKAQVEKSEAESFDNTVTFEGKKYVNLGNTFRTDIDVEVGTILEVNVQELTVMNGRLSWDKPQVTGIEHGISIPYPASKALSIASKYNGVIQKAEKRSASQEDLQEFDEGGRDKFNVKSGDEGTLSIDEHITFLDEDGAKEFTRVHTYEAWKTAKKRLEGHSGSLHNDIRIKIDDSDFLCGFTATVGSVNNRNKVLDNQEGDKVLVASFKAHTPHGKTKWQTDVGVGEAWIFEPGEIGSPGKRWSAIFKVEKKARVKIGRIDDHFVEMRITDTKYMLGGRWILMFAPLNPGQRSWIFMRPKKQEYDDTSLNEEVKPVVKVQKGSLLKAVMENLEGK
jgi:hypothetical protein